MNSQNLRAVDNGLASLRPPASLLDMKPQMNAGGEAPSTESGRRFCGVNLGGWLVLERWMAPALFEEFAPEAADESSLLSIGGAAAQEAVEKFREQFIVEEDFRWLREVGNVNAVRLPLGFWCLEEHAEGTPYLPTSAFVDRVFDWAEAHELGVILDLHGAVGSQNGEHHSGDSSGSTRWLKGTNRAKNLSVLRAWSVRWGRRHALFGLGLGNEVAEPRPAAGASADGASADAGGVGSWLLRACCARGNVGEYWPEVAAFYADAAALCRPHLRPDTLLVIDTCWDSSRWEDSSLRAIPGPFLLDYHHYECMGAAYPAEDMEMHGWGQGRELR
mmetsp:Transcript_48971/g.157539  ORF Transcript_48971/g.157539 Transcript_48971/m.157539 type:complete len:332 (+) Transcript_48971:67-1062(+)